MPHVPVPHEIDAFLARPNPAVVGTVRPDGAPHTAATWYDWEDGRVLLNMEDTRVRLGYMRANPHVSLTVLEDGRSGIIVDDYREMAGALAAADALEPLDLRTAAEERFSRERMVDDYLRAFEAAIAAS